VRRGQSPPLRTPLNQHRSGQLLLALPPGTTNEHRNTRHQNSNFCLDTPRYSKMAASTFSYAQAAKGVSTPVSQSKPASGAATPAKDVGAKAANGPVGSVPSWADDAESESATEQTTTTREVQAPAPSAAPAQPTQSVETSSISSPDLGASASSASTVTKDDDVSSLPNASSESTWDNKSQASTSVDKSVEPAEKTSEKVKKGKNAVVKPLQEAPLPAVNPWKKRADELKSKIQKPTLSNGVSHGASTKKGESDAKAQSATGAGRFKSDEDRSAHSRKESRAETETKKDGKAKSAASAQLPPPKRDQESWPTPETVINEDRKKAQEKGEKEPKESVPVASNGKNEWVKVPFTPSVVFNTPLPNAAGSRRGGRPSGRGGAQPGGRPTTYGGSQPEKDGSAPVITNGDHSKRERVEGAATQDASPKTKRTGSAASPTLKNQAPAATSEKPAKAHGLSGAEPEFRPRTAQSAPDASQAGHHGNTYPRQFSNRPNKPRRGDMSFAGERRRDGEVSPAKDNTFDPAATQTEAHADGDRRHSTYHEGPNGHQQKHGRFGSYAGGRERGRGGGRGGRGSYANGHQYSSSHMSAQSTSSFSLGPRSPTTFNPENPSFFAAPQGKYGRNGHRSQSVTTDPYRFAPYQAGPPVAPINTYGMYDYSMMQQPMSAVPYAPYVDQFALMAMLTTQVYVF
jgi:la-related protein 1